MAPPKRQNKFESEHFLLTFEHAAVSADTVLKLLRADRKMRVYKAEYLNITGLAEDAANFFDVRLENGGVLMYNHSTETTVGEGTIAADTWTTLQTDPALADLEKDEELNLNLDETGTATLPAGRLTLHCRYL